MKKFSVLLLSVLMSINVFAFDYEVIEDTSMTFPSQVFLLINNGKESPVVCDKVNVFVDDFGELGKTIRIEPVFSGEGLEILKKGNSEHLLNFFVSGKNLSVISFMADGEKEVAVMRGDMNRNPIACVRFGKAQGYNVCVIMKSDETQTFNDFYKGMSKSEVEKYASEVGQSRFTFVGNKDGLKCYALKFLDMNKVYNMFGDYHYKIDNNTDYFYFYFDANNKLVKWIQLI